MSRVGDEWYVWSQFQSIDARAVFPSFDEPGFKTPFSVTVNTLPGHMAVSNAPETGTTEINGMVKHRFADTLPLPTYLVAIVVGPFVSAEGVAPPTPQRAYPLPIRIIATQPQKDKLQFALEQTPPIIAHLEDYFGQAFPYPKLDQIASPIMPGAMENAGADIYNDDIILFDDGASTAQKRSFGMIVAHELSHQWFGDLVTPVWWDDIWLNESFANWMGYYVGDKWRPDLNIGAGAIGEAFDAMGTDALVVGRPIRQPIRTNGEIDSAFDSITYGKGGQVVAMIAAFMGEEKFRAGVQLHMSRYSHGNASSPQFFGSLADAAGDERVLAAMKSFVDQAGVPVVSFARDGAGWRVTQSRYVRLDGPVSAQQWVIPLCVRQDETRTCTLIDDRSESITLPGTGAFMPNAGGTGYYRFSLPGDAWDALIATGATLPAGEGLALVDSLSADFSAGTGTVDRMVAAARVLADNPDSRVATEMGDKLGGLRRRGFISAEALPGYERTMGAIYGPALARLGFTPAAGAYASDTPDRQALRLNLVNLMSREARDASVRSHLRAAATAFLAGDTTALDQTFYNQGLIVYVEDGGLEATKALFAALKSARDGVSRNAILRNVGGGNSLETGQWLLTQINDPALRSTDRLAILGGLAGAPRTRDMAYEWVKAHFDDISRSVGIFGSARLITLPSGYCSAAMAKDVDAFLRPKVEALDRGMLPFERMIESIEGCGQLKAARSEAVTAYFMGLK